MDLFYFCREKDGNDKGIPFIRFEKAMAGNFLAGHSSEVKCYGEGFGNEDNFDIKSNNAYSSVMVKHFTS